MIVIQNPYLASSLTLITNQPLETGTCDPLWGKTIKMPVHSAQEISANSEVVYDKYNVFQIYTLAKVYTNMD